MITGLYWCIGSVTRVLTWVAWYSVVLWHRCITNLSEFGEAWSTNVCGQATAEFFKQRNSFAATQRTVPFTNFCIYFFVIFVSLIVNLPEWRTLFGIGYRIFLPHHFWLVFQRVNIFSCHVGRRNLGRQKSLNEQTSNAIFFISNWLSCRLQLSADFTIVKYVLALPNSSHIKNFNWYSGIQFFGKQHLRKTIR
jgi:hypothetical protein